MNQEQENKTISESNTNGELVEKDDTQIEIESITGLLKGITEPLAKGQETAEQEATKRTEILAGVATKMIYGAILIAVLVVLLAAFAMWKENSNLAEKLVIALFAFLGGMGAGKTVSK